jgi:hypothetical protein
MLTRGGQQDIKEVAEANTMSIEPTISNNTHWSTKVRYTMSVDVTRQIMSRLKMAKTSVVRYHRSLPSRVRNACRRSVHALLDPKTLSVKPIFARAKLKRACHLGHLDASGRACVRRKGGRSRHICRR